MQSLRGSLPPRRWSHAWRAGASTEKKSKTSLVSLSARGRLSLPLSLLARLLPLALDLVPLLLSERRAAAALARAALGARVLARDGRGLLLLRGVQFVRLGSRSPLGASVLGSPR